MEPKIEPCPLDRDGLYPDFEIDWEFDSDYRLNISVTLTTEFHDFYCIAFVVYDDLNQSA